MSTFMIIVLILLGFTCIGLLITLLDSDSANSEYRGAIGAMTGLIIICFVTIILDIKDDPQAIDVYRGKTALEITYKVVDEGKIVPKDSTVIFK